MSRQAKSQETESGGGKRTAGEHGTTMVAMGEGETRREVASGVVDAPLTLEPRGGDPDAWRRRGRATGTGRERVFHASHEHLLDAAPHLVWSILSDSNRWDRNVGMNPSSYSYQTVAPGVRARVGSTRYYGVALAWVEVGEWVEGSSMWGERRFVKALIPRAGFRFELEPADGNGDTTRATFTVYAAGTNLLGYIIALYWRLVFRLTLRRYLVALERWLSGHRSDGPFEVGSIDAARAPPSLRARALLLEQPPAEVVSGAITSRRSDRLAQVAARLREHVDEDICARLVDHIATRPDEELAAIRPFDLATAWGVERRPLLAAFLHAARVGMVDLCWQLICPRCRVGAAFETRIERLGREVHCEDCDIAFDVDFAHNVEAVFVVNASIARIEPRVYCASSPWLRPHVYALFVVQPNERRELDAPLPRGEIVARVPGATASQAIAVPARPSTLTLTLNDDGVAAHLQSGGDADRIVIESRRADAVSVMVERAGWQADIVRGSVMLTMPEFIDLFATDAPATGAQLEIGALTALFSDLIGSTSLYERLGDARAFAVVQEHFRDVTAIIAEHEGAVLKTMGDAVMASFPAPPQALAAAIAMVRRAEEEGREHGLDSFAIKVGIHEGPCLVVRANGQIDLFGTTVNVASRLQGRARAGEIVVLDALWQRLASAQRPLRSASFRATLRGLEAVRDLIAIDARSHASARPPAPSFDGRRDDASEDRAG